MGGVAGHLSHLQENLNFTFGEIKSVLEQVASGEMEAVEKVDGQNIFFTYNAEAGDVRTARNPGDIKSGGMSPAALLQKFKNHPAEAAFVNGFKTIERAIMSLSEADRVAAFGENGDTYVNAEIMYPSNPNIIVYDGNYIVMHNASAFDADGNGTPVPENFGSIVSAMETAEDQVDAESWQVKGPQAAALKDITDGSAYADFLSELSQAAPGASDDMTLGDYVEEKLRTGPVGDIPIPVHKQEQLIKRIIGLGLGTPGDDLPSMRDLKSGQPKDVQKRISAIATKVNSRKVIGAQLKPIEIAIHNFAVEVLRGMQSFFVSDQEGELARQREELEQAVREIEAAKDAGGDARRDTLQRQLSKLGDIENIASTMEGVVFEHPPGSNQLYKLTGTFAPANQIVGGARRMPKEQNEALLRNYISERLAIMVG